MKILTKTLYEAGSILRLPPENCDPVPDGGKSRVNIYNVERQEIFGFGGAFTESSAYTYAMLDEAGKKKALQMLFGKEGLRYNFCRICIGSSDFSVDQYQYVEDGDETLSTFSIERDRKYVIPMIKDAMKVAAEAGEEIIFFASPWSPPAFMKDNKDRVRGHLLPEYLDLYAEYIVKFIKAYEAEGIHITAVTPQNEPLANSMWDGCIFDADQEIALIRSLHRAFTAHGLDVAIWAYDHNKGRLYHRLEKVYAEVPEMVAGGAFHWYSGSHFDELSLLKELYPDKLLIHTEFCNALGRKFFDTYGSELMGNFNHGCNAECEWNLMLDQLGAPYHHRVCGCSAPLLSDGAELTPRQSYYEMYLFSHFVRRGAHALATSSYCRELCASAFRNPDGKLVVVVNNLSDKEISYNLSVFNYLIPTSITPHTLIAYEIEA